MNGGGSATGTVSSGSGSNVWHGNNDYVGGEEVIEIEGCSQFHRIWSAIQFVFATPFGENEYTVEEMFGEGLNWAGCSLIYLLGQQRRFEIVDFGTHFLRLQRVDNKNSTIDGVVIIFYRSVIMQCTVYPFILPMSRDEAEYLSKNMTGNLYIFIMICLRSLLVLSVHLTSPIL